MPSILLTKRQRVAALMAGLDGCGLYAKDGTNYQFSWDAESTGYIVKRIKDYTPENSSCAIPYKSLIVKILTAHRAERGIA